jgi:FlaG/FlaF family flagellin (archaellin)
MFRNRRILLALGAVALIVGLLAAGSVFTASNTVPNASLGQGANTISGYTVSGVTYTPNGSNPANIDSVSFTISPSAAGTVEIQLVSGGAWYTCSNSSGSVTCATTSPQATAGAANSLNVVAGS